MSKWTYFTDEEVDGLDQELVAKLDLARGKSGVPFTITSGLRTPDKNDMSGGVEDSAHLTGLAVDLRVPDGQARFVMAKALLEVGFVRMGIYDQHLHVDLDTTKPQNVIWIGLSH